MIILASASPRRKELLSSIISDFICIPSSIDETVPDTVTANETAEYLATKKALEIFKNKQDDIVIGSDTVIVFNNKAYGKPQNKEDAKSMLKDFSNNTHSVITGVCIASKERTISFSSVNKVSFYKLTDEEIDEYLKNDEYIDKAGAYAIQGKGALFIKDICGDYNSIVGLPIAQLYRTLKLFYNI